MKPTPFSAKARPRGCRTKPARGRVLFAIKPGYQFLVALTALLLALAGCSALNLAAAPTLPPPTNTPAPRPFPTVTPTPSPTPRPAPTSTATATATHTPAPQPTAAAAPTPTPLPAGCRPDPALPCRIDHVVIISIDGLRPDALAQADTPALDALIQAGAYSPSARAVLPSVTLVNHASMLGGMSPEKHGIDWNELLPERGKIKGPTLFSVVHAAGLSTAMVVGKPKFEHLVLPNSVDNYIYAGFLDVQVAGRALEVIQAGLPNLLFIHLPDVDTAGHATGWMSAAQLLVIGQTDSQVSRLVDALKTGNYLNTTLLLVVSDHGGRETWHGEDTPEQTTVPWLAVGPGVPAGLSLHSRIAMYDTAATTLYALKLPIPPEWDGRPVTEIFGPKE